MDIPDNILQGFYPSNTSVVFFNDKLIANVKFVNYNLVDGRYICP
jgi:hypothetical protein